MNDSFYKSKKIIKKYFSHVDFDRCIVGGVSLGSSFDVIEIKNQNYPHFFAVKMMKAPKEKKIPVLLKLFCL